MSYYEIHSTPDYTICIYVIVFSTNERFVSRSKVVLTLRLNPIIPSLFLNSIYPGGGKFAPPYKMPNNGREVPKLSWNLISYRD